jgi:hypothetical protein
VTAAGIEVRAVGASLLAIGRREVVSPRLPPSIGSVQVNA